MPVRRLSSCLQLTFDLFRQPVSKVSGLEPDEVLRQKSVNLLRGAGAPILAGRVGVFWSGRLQSTAGKALYSQARVILNPGLRSFGGAEVDRTLRHELAHLLAQYRAGRRRISPHGTEWRQACADLGVPGESRCHTLPLPRRKVARKYFYACPQCRAVIPRVRKMRRKCACLACCRRHSHGRYDERFRLALLPPEPP